MLQGTQNGNKMPEINTKQLSIKLFDEGYFGNSIYLWYDLNKWFRESSDDKLYVLRQYTRAKGGSGYCEYNLTPLEVVREIQRLRREGWNLSTFCVSEAMPDHAVTLQGEYMAGPSTLFYSTEIMHMRPALEAGGKHAYGPSADLMIRSAMEPIAYEKFRELVHGHPLSVIEFSVYSIPVGIKHWQTMIWEVRNY